ncbi:YbjN domain-containing protein [Halosquirtibacter laminarini]|uniref:YbjN domain-containing protein n=1 Tax=Halosquirtibacter laminarini TaxID=3374600 RepID=A0AC61NLL1_9BACT|nr:YbjN domain-containing protein [Prolixibacteraceae bacterium]
MSTNKFELIRLYLLEEGYTIVEENKEDSLYIAEKPSAGIKNLMVDCEEPILVMEMPLFEFKTLTTEAFQKLLMKNREIVHGAFALNETGKKVIFCDTLQLEHLDQNEFVGTLNSLELLLGEFGEELIELSKL